MNTRLISFVALIAPIFYIVQGKNDHLTGSLTEAEIRRNIIVARSNERKASRNTEKQARRNKTFDKDKRRQEILNKRKLKAPRFTVNDL